MNVKLVFDGKGYAWYKWNKNSQDWYKRRFAWTSESDLKKIKDYAKKSFTWWEMACQNYISTDIREVIDGFIDCDVADSKIKETFKND